LLFQYFANFCTFSVDDTEKAEFDEIIDKIRPYALKSHWAGDLGLLNVQPAEYYKKSEKQ